MAVDISGIESSRAGIDRPVYVPVPEEVVSNQVQQEIQQILKRDVTAAEVVAFLAGQSSRLQSLQSPTPIKALSAEIPPPHEDVILKQDPTVQVTSIEMQSLEEFAMRVTSESGGAGEFINGADSILDNLHAQYGDPNLAEGEGLSGGIFDWLMVGEISKEAGEIDRRWQKTIAALLKGKGDVITLLMALGEYMTDKYGRAMTEAFKMYSAKQEAHQNFVAGLGLEKGPLGATDMFKAQQEQQAFMMDSQMSQMVIQDNKRQLDSAQNLIKSTASSVHQTLQEILRHIGR